jgi:hypothetical protein
MLDFDLKVFDINNFITEDEFSLLHAGIKKFDIDLSEIEMPLGFLCWSDRIQSLVKESDVNRYNKMVDTNIVTKEDYFFLCDVNKQYGLKEHDYFNFLLTYHKPIDILQKFDVYSILRKANTNMVKELFGKPVNIGAEDTFFGHINVYPRDSFIKKHTDIDPAGKRLYTSIFFLNNGRTIDDGSVLRVYTNNGVVDVVPDFRKIVVLEHQVYNYVHEVTPNMVDDVRYSIYSSFTTVDYENRIDKR